MKISSKRVRRHTLIFYNNESVKLICIFEPVRLQLNLRLTIWFLFVLVATATAVRVLRRRADPGVLAPLWGVRPGLLRLLPGPGPLLRLGRGDLLGLHPLHQEVRATHTRTHAHTHAHARIE